MGNAPKTFFGSIRKGLSKAFEWAFGDKNKRMFWRVTIAVLTFSLLVIAMEVITMEFRNEIHLIEHRMAWKRHATEASNYSYNLSRGFYYNAEYKGKYFIAERETNRHVVDGIDWLCKGSGHFAVVAKNGRRGYFNTVTGKWLVKPKTYTRAWLFSEGAAAVVKDGRMQFIDTQGQLKMNGRSFPYDDTHDYSLFHDGTFAVLGENMKWGIINLKGEWLVEPMFDDIRYKEGSYFVNREQEWTKLGDSE